MESRFPKRQPPDESLSNDRCNGFGRPVGKAFIDGVPSAVTARKQLPLRTGAGYLQHDF